VNLAYFAAVALVTLAVAGFQLQLLTFSGVLEISFFRAIYHGCWIVTLCLTLFLLIVRRDLFRRAVPVLLVCGLCACIALIHPIDAISRSFLAVLLLTICGTVLATSSAALALVRLSAAATVLGAALCLLDILFVFGFSDIVGRAAGTNLNPNIAAAGLLLAASGSFWAVPRDWRTPFVMIVAAAILTTLSRSNIVAAVLICILICAVLIHARLNVADPRRPTRWLRGSMLCLCLAGWIGTAFWLNAGFSKVIFATLRQVGSASSVIANARENAVEGSNSGADAALAQNAKQAEAIGLKNSLAARGLLFENAVLAYRSGPTLGRGLATAHALSPHNSFLLFAIAFGNLGWLVPVAFLFLSAYWVRTIDQVPIVLATFAVLMTSHDVLLMPGLLLPVVIGVAALNARLSSASDQPSGITAIGYGALAVPALFALGWLLGTSVPLASARPAPALLWILTFGASVLWAAAIWRWSGRLSRQTL